MSRARKRNTRLIGTGRWAFGQRSREFRVAGGFWWNFSSFLGEFFVVLAV
jgi:hypothetical protein